MTRSGFTYSRVRSYQPGDGRTYRIRDRQRVELPHPPQCDSREGREQPLKRLPRCCECPCCAGKGMGIEFLAQSIDMGPLTRAPYGGLTKTITLNLRCFNIRLFHSFGPG